MRVLLTAVLVIIFGQVSYAQIGGIGNRAGGGGATGAGGGVGGGNFGAGAQGGQGNAGGGGFGSGFSFDPRFSATTVDNPFGGGGMNAGRAGAAGMGGLGMGMGGMGMGGLGMGGMGGMGLGMGMGMGMGGLGMGGFGMGGMGMQQQQQSKLRPTVRLGFEVERPSPVRRSQQAQMTLSRLPQAERFAGVNVVMDGNRAIATGSLENSADAGLLRQLLLLEPGIYQVDVSQLTPSERSATASENQGPENLELPPESGSSETLVPPPQN